ncbi:hypothetical protein B0T26DRAFT_742517 [Lasiosphaeria miniovina]|uniref:YwbE family protein n=1 Tax=Lasiosphaeria miniovina TaxID=1954250 RepID=A0AA40DUP7_9PEZI|nr:uncharacterized protein B0T26DRAFT_742517 [Lasiosphaeria miniovina]KAK0714112.1 hypothetical protein B0T26DRAFT_742517 [Lasiosphaeria miniovina]
MPRVPTIRDVVPGAYVDIVLKADQPTGRTVAGTVQDVLTRGNHPHGIKVRLVDGRVGRVQTMAAAPGHGPSTTTPHGDPGPSSSTNWASPGQGYDHDLPSGQIGLDAFVKPARQRPPETSTSANCKSQSGGGSVDGPTVAQETSSCPVCSAFDGDATAVAHHVASHFDD